MALTWKSDKFETISLEEVFVRSFFLLSTFGIYWDTTHFGTSPADFKHFWYLQYLQEAALVSIVIVQSVLPFSKHFSLQQHVYICFDDLFIDWWIKSFELFN